MVNPLTAPLSSTLTAQLSSALTAPLSNTLTAQLSSALTAPLSNEKDLRVSRGSRTAFPQAPFGHLRGAPTAVRRP